MTENNTAFPVFLLDVSDVAEILKCSARTVYRLADAGKIPSPCRLGGLRRWSKAAIEDWIVQGCPATALQQRRSCR